MAWLNFSDQQTRIAVFSAGISCFVALVSASVSVFVTFSGQQRQMDRDLVASFVANGGQLSFAGGEFITAVNLHKDITPLKVKLNSEVFKQLDQIQRLEERFKLDQQDAASFKSYLTELSSLTNAVHTADQMPQWAEGFGRVLDADKILTKRFHSSSDKNI